MKTYKYTGTEEQLREAGFRKTHYNSELYWREKYNKQIYVDMLTRDVDQIYFNAYLRPVKERYIVDLLKKGMVEVVDENK